MITFIDTLLGPVGFDAVLSETISASSTVTSNPIETGAEINDHIFTNPKIYTLSAGVTNTPLHLSSSDIFTSDIAGFDFSRRESAWEVLNILHEAGDIFSVQAGLELLDNMVITSLDTTTDAATQGALIFSATLQQLTIVDTALEQLSADQLQVIAKPKASPVKDAGKVSKKPVDEALLVPIARFTGAPI
jgi:hypothetical protein